MNDLVKPFDHIPTEKFVADAFSFEYPKGAKVVDFNRRDKGSTWRLLINLAGTEYGYDIKHVRVEESIELLAKEKYDSASSKSFPEDLSPFDVFFGKARGWRYRYRFLDGFSAPLVIETVLLEGIASDHAYQLQYAASPDQYSQGLIVFEMLVRSFRFVTS